MLLHKKLKMFMQDVNMLLNLSYMVILSASLILL